MTEKTIDLIKKACGEDKTWSLSMFSTETVQLADGSYKKARIPADQEFFLTDVYEGKREPFVFVFVPVDAQEYAKVELPARHVFTKIPDLEAHVTTAMGAGPDCSFNQAVKAADKAIKKAQREAEKERQAQIEQELAEGKTPEPIKPTSEINAKNPHWGMF